MHQDTEGLTFIPTHQRGRYISPAERVERLKRPGEDWRTLDDLSAMKPDERIVEQLVVDQHGTRRVGWKREAQ